MFQASIYKSRREKLREHFPDKGLLLFMGNEESPKNYKDNTYHYRQDSTFLYYFGWSTPGLTVVMDMDEGTTTLFGNDFTIEDIIWMGPQPSVREMANQVGIEKTGTPEQLKDLLLKTKFRRRPIHFLPPYRAENTMKIASWLGCSLKEIESNPSTALIQCIVAQRSIKEEVEIVEMEKAVNISGAMHVLALKTKRPGMRESEIAGLVEGVAVGNGGDLAYPAIVTVNGQTLHNHFHGNLLKSGQLLLIDAGAETAMGYAGDVTRTFPVDNQFTDLQKEIYSIVLQAELAAIDKAQPGTKNLDVHLTAAKVITEGLKSVGLLKGTTEDIIATGAHALFFPHGIGHMIGLDVHDMEDLGENLVGYSHEVERSNQFGLRALRLGRSLQPGFAITIEPGIYFIPELIDLWKGEKKFLDFINYENIDRFRNFGGIRIEDNILITANGNRLLGEPIPKTIDEIENI